MTEVEHWSLIHAERARLAEFLNELEPAQWRAQSLCSDWTIEQVVAHLSAAANTGRWAWIRSIVAAGFNPAKHNARLLSRYRGRTPGETLTIFRDSTTATIAPTKDFAVNSKTLVKGLSLEADDVDFRIGSGPLVTGKLLDLVMALAGRPTFAAALRGEGADELRHRMS